MVAIPGIHMTSPSGAPPEYLLSEGCETSIHVPQSISARTDPKWAVFLPSGAILEALQRLGIRRASTMAPSRISR